MRQFVIIKSLHELKYKVQRVPPVLEYKYSAWLYFSPRARSHACTLLILPVVLNRGTVGRGVHERGAGGHACAQARNAAVTPINQHCSENKRKQR